jgi:lysophospholipase L1-like esterase
MSRNPYAALVVVLLGVLLVGIGQLLAHAGPGVVCDAEFWAGARNLRRCVRYLFPTARAGCTQLGAATIAIGLAWLILAQLAAERRATILEGVRRWTLRIVAVLAISLLSGEIALRLFFSDGMSFGGHGGPLVRQFEREFVFNRYDGPSRGPEVEGPKAAGWKRILIQGDSITWGQGVKRESQIYSHQLLERLRRHNPRIEVAALASGGREIDGHLTHLRKWGPQIDPDVIIYQWFVNDIELDKAGRPRANLPWRNLFVHPILAAGSAFWFFLDHSLTQLWPTDRTYEEYIDTDFAPGTAKWSEFEGVFTLWATEARRLTPRVLVALYPRVNPPAEMLYADVHERVRALCAAQDLQSIELIEAFRELEGDYDPLWASPFDAHPSALAHALIAKALDERLRSTWPDLTR